MQKLNHTDNGNGQTAIVDENSRCIAFIPKLHPDAEKYIKLFENSIDMIELLKELVRVFETECTDSMQSDAIYYSKQLIKKATE